MLLLRSATFIRYSIDLDLYGNFNTPAYLTKTRKSAKCAKRSRCETEEHTEIWGDQLSVPRQASLSPDTLLVQKGKRAGLSLSELSVFRSLSLPAVLQGS